MKTIKEVCEMFDVTRKTLRGYDECGLLHPSARSEDGNQSWLYDEAAINTLWLIQIMIEVGYERKEVKEKLEDRSLKMVDLCDELLEKLNKKRNHLDNMANMLNGMKVACRLPVHVIKALAEDGEENVDFFAKELAEAGGWKKALDEETFLLDSNLSSDDWLSLEMYMSLVAIGKLKKKPINAEDVKNCFVNFTQILWKMMKRGVEEDEELDMEMCVKALEEITQEDFDEVYSDIRDELLDDEDLAEALKVTCGQDGYEFILKVLGKYKMKKPNFKIDREEEQNDEE